MDTKIKFYKVVAAYFLIVQQQRRGHDEEIRHIVLHAAEMQFLHSDKSCTRPDKIPTEQIRMDLNICSKWQNKTVQM